MLYLPRTIGGNEDFHAPKLKCLKKASFVNMNLHNLTTKSWPYGHCAVFLTTIFWLFENITQRNGTTFPPEWSNRKFVNPIFLVICHFFALVASFLLLPPFFSRFQCLLNLPLYSLNSFFLVLFLIELLMAWMRKILIVVLHVIYNSCWQMD